MQVNLRILNFVLAILLVFFVSCSGPLTMENNGHMVEYPVDTEFELELKANPTTGYVWTITEINGSVVKSIGEPVYKAESDKLGAPGLYTFTFKTIAPGNSPLKLIYHRPETGEAAVDSFDVHIISGTMGRIEAE